MLNPELNLKQARDFYAQHQAISIPNILEDSFAKAIYTALTELDWVLEINDYGPSPRLRIPVKTLRNPDAPLLNVLDEIPNNINRDKLFYIRFNVDGTAFENAVLVMFADFLNSDDFIVPMRSILGYDTISHCWIEATCYQSCCFLGGHSDDHNPANRVAFVFNLTPHWQMDWGGLLMLKQGSIQPNIVPPLWNSLAMFTVPRDHWVTTVSPAAKGERYSLTGWLRDGPVVDYSTGEGS